MSSKARPVRVTHKPGHARLLVEQFLDRKVDDPDSVFLLYNETHPEFSSNLYRIQWNSAVAVQPRFRTIVGSQRGGTAVFVDFNRFYARSPPMSATERQPHRSAKRNP